jgi:hypothetical protein
MNNVIKYDIRAILSKKYNQNTKIKRIYVCIFSINNIDNNPFLVYLLYKHSDPEILTFPNILFKNDILKESKGLFTKITATEQDPEGYLTYKGDAYVFFNLKIHYKVQNKYEAKNELWWGTIYEICNSKEILYFKIQKCVSDLFLNNQLLIFLLDNHNNSYKIPRIGYYGCYHSLLSYVSLLGVQQSSYSPYGNFFYFNNYQRSVKYGGWSFKGNDISENKYIKTDKFDRYDMGGVVRFAVFLHNTKLFLNHPDDQNTKFEKSSDSNFYKKIPKLVDLTGQWAKKYNSAYIGVLKTKDSSGNDKIFHGSIREQYIVKDLTDYVALSSHVLNKKSLGKEWKLEDDYKII